MPRLIDVKPKAGLMVDIKPKVGDLIDVKPKEGSFFAVRGRVYGVVLAAGQVIGPGFFMFLTYPTTGTAVWGAEGADITWR